MVGEAADGTSAVAVVARTHADVAVLDIRMPGNGIRAAAEIAAAHPETVVVMLTVSEDVEDLFGALRVGAAGYDRRSVGGSGQGRRERRSDGDHDPVDVVIANRPTDAWWTLALGRDPTPDERFVLDPARGPGTAFGLVPDAGVVRAAVVDDHLHLSRLAVRPAARRTGVGTRVTAAAAAWGHEHGARWVVVQVARQKATPTDA